ncbi:hypothetical protein AMK68_01020 [candidate division KD3-62 bacterium DG_56]|uniref:Peptidase M48 domain-containing protein n=1 Tax=candidate division KD3-62 bacterium DG_56 TaxID=1704032 RepID=A0A0S7XQD7_9BACT|nr:MAG: hypothetical protein AMK68_01020 [candidate division KD3-62 bacterium DG_56]
MAVRVRLDRGKKEKAALTLDDFRHPQEVPAHRRALQEAVAIWVVMIGFVTLLGTFFGKQQKPLIFLILPAVAAGWILLSLLYFLVIARGSERRQEAELRKEQKRGAMAGSPDAAAARALEEAARNAGRSLGAGVSTVALVDGPPEARLVGGAVTVSRSLQEQLSPQEIACIIARQLGHLRAKHANLMGAADRVAGLDRLVRHSLALPITILLDRLRAWTPYAERTADRAALVLTQNHKLCSSAIIKEAIARYGGEVVWREKDGWQFDEGFESSEERGIQTEELSAYLAREGELQLDSGDMTAHYRLGEFLRQHPDVHSRVAELAQFAASPEYRAAVEKAAPAK